MLVLPSRVGLTFGPLGLGALTLGFFLGEAEIGDSPLGSEFDRRVADVGAGSSGEAELPPPPCSGPSSGGSLEAMIP